MNAVHVMCANVSTLVLSMNLAENENVGIYHRRNHSCGEIWIQRGCSVFNLRGANQACNFSCNCLDLGTKVSSVMTNGLY